MSMQKEQSTHGEAEHNAEGARSENVEIEASDASGSPNGAVEEASGHSAADDDLEHDADVLIEGPEDVIARLESELVEANTRAAEYLDRMQRSAAEFQNVRKRQEKQLYESIGRATEGLIRKLLPVLDDFDLAFKNQPEELSGEVAAWIEGFERVQQKLITILAEEGIETIDSSGLFDPTLHEAVSLEPSESVESGHVIETLRTGYRLRQAVLRPALVRVAQ